MPPVPKMSTNANGFVRQASPPSSSESERKLDRESSQGTPHHIKTVLTQSHSNVGTYGGQSKLPRLPIPSLDETLDKFPKVLEALQTQEEHEETKRVVEEFRSGAGPTLQNLLVEYEQEGFEAGTLGSYVEEFWNESYLSPEESVVLNLNPFFVLEGGPDPKTATDQLARAASLCFASIKLASALKNERLKPDIFRGNPLCMDQFRVLFGSSRQPHLKGRGDNLDNVFVYPDSTHIVVLCRNQFYYFPVLWPETYELAVDERDIRDILKAIQNNAESLSAEEVAETGIGGLTALPRSAWAGARQDLCRAEVNELSLSVIDSALLVLVLDDYTPEDVHHCAANMLHGTNIQVDKGQYFQQEGTCLNRWYDKIQLIVCKGGCAGVNFEHSAIDGHTALRFVSDVFAETVLTFAESITHQIHGRGSLLHIIEATVTRAVDLQDADGNLLMDVQPRKLLFELTPALKKTIYYAETALCDQMVANDTHVLEFNDYGKLLIVGNSLSPDALVQMSILLAYYRLYGYVVCQYEPVLTKAFYHGRTEAIRTTTPLAKQLCEVFCSDTATPEMKLKALHAATKEHSRLCKESACGKGVDRHLFALKCIAARKGLSTPAFFESNAWKSIGHTILSTSNCGNPALRLFGFGPVVPDGFGVGYIVKDHGLSYSVASKHRQTLRYVRTLQTVLREIHTLLQPLSHVRVMERPKQSAPKEPVPPLVVKDDMVSYDDIYGESGPQVPLARVSKKTIQNPKKRNAKDRSRLFSSVREQSNEFDLDDAPHVLVDLDLMKSWGDVLEE